jgi:hypothetical protein
MVTRGNKKARQRFFVTSVGKSRIIFGYPWLRTFQPDVDWANGQLKGPKTRIETLLFGKYQRIKQYIDAKKEAKHQEDFILENNHTKRSPWSGVTPDTQGGRVEINKAHNVIEMAHKYAAEHGQKEVTLPKEFERHTALFSDEEASKFPPSRPWDHKIELLENAPTKFNCKVYPMSLKEQEAEDKFLDDNLAKGYIAPSDSPYGFSTFMVPKKDSKELRYIIDYRPLNAVTRKDVTPLPNLAQCVEDLQGMELFSKFDVRWGYNNLRIRPEDQWKGAFKTRRGLFEPKVMFFGMSNSPGSFQRFINHILEPWYKKWGWKKGKNYMDDIGIGTKLAEADC